MVTCKVPRIRTSLGNASFTAVEWNHLPFHLSDFELSLLEFRQLLKMHLFGWQCQWQVTYQNLRSRFGIERYAYIETNSVCTYVCMYVCMCKNSSQTTEPICIKIIPANRASYADCYRLLRFEIFTKYDEYFVPESALLLHRHIFATGSATAYK